MSTPLVRDQEITRQFEATREHRMAHIDRLYDFEPDPEPVTVTATDPNTGEVVAHFHVDAEGKVEDLLAVPQPEHRLTSHALGVEADSAPLVVIDAPGELAAAPIAPEPSPITQSVFGEDYADGLTVGGLLVFSRDLSETNLPVRAKVKAWTTQDGTVTRLAVVAP